MNSKEVVQTMCAYGPYQESREHGYSIRKHYTGPSYRDFLSHWDIQSGAKVLDIASGRGEAADYIESLFGATVIRTDLSILPLQLQHRRHSARPPVSVANAFSQPFSDESFDAIHFKDALVHIEDKEALFHEVSRLLKPNGRVLFVTQPIFAGNSFFVMYRQKPNTELSFIDTDDYVRQITEIQKQMKFNGKKVISISPPYFGTQLVSLPTIAARYGLHLDHNSSFAIGWISAINETDWLPVNRKVIQFVKTPKKTGQSSVY